MSSLTIVSEVCFYLFEIVRNVKKTIWHAPLDSVNYLEFYEAIIPFSVFG